METFGLVVIIFLLAVLFVIFVVICALLWQLTARLITLISIWRYGRRFFKSIERFRRDFSK